MKKVRFSKLFITNFRNINNLEIDFNDKVTEIYGSNGVGKSNTLSAIMWCLFGKDIEDTKQFVISPIINGKEDNSINTIVKLIINDNYVVERSYCKRITSLKTGWIIDGKEQCVQITQSNYQKELDDNLVDEETFKSLSNINYVPNLNWKDLKKLIFDLIGGISDNEVLLRDDFNLIEEYVTKFGIEQTQKLLQDTDKELSNDIKRLETEYQTLINTKDKYVADEKENQELINRKKEIEEQLYSSKKNQDNYQKRLDTYNESMNSINELKTKIYTLDNSINYNKQLIIDYDDLYRKNGIDEEALRHQELESLDKNVEFVNYSIKQEMGNIKEQKEKLNKIASCGNELKSKEIKIEDSKCSACGQELPEELKEKTLKKLKDEQLKDLNDIQQRYDHEKLCLKQLEDSLTDMQEELKKYNDEIEKVKVKEYKAETETEKQKQIRITKEQKEIENNNLKKEYDDLVEKKEILGKELSILEKPTYDFDDNMPLKLELEDINNKLATTITLNKISEDIDSTLKELNTKKDNKISNKDKMQQVVKFNNVKADLLQQKVRNYFKLLCFRTKEYTLTGDEVETFKIENSKGVLFNETNNGDKIALGLDLLQGIQKARDIYVPILCDNFESYTGDYDANDTQLIITRVVKEIEKIEVK